MAERQDQKRKKDNVYWDETKVAYRYKKSNRLLSNKQLYKIVAQEIKRFENKIAKLSDRFVNGAIGFENWQIKMSELTRNAHVNLLRLGKGGKNKTYAVDYLKIGRELKDTHYFALSKFSQDIAQGKLTKKQIVNKS